MLTTVWGDMTFSRRLFLATCASLPIAACANSGPAQTIAATSGLPLDLRPVPNADFAAWLRGFQGRARVAGISEGTLN
jgi:membrane-bound lytic murein transglycosylase B